MKKNILFFLLTIFIVSSCVSFSKNVKKKRYKTTLTIYVEEKSNKQITLNQIRARESDMIALYVYGSKFKNIDGKEIKIIGDNNLTSEMYEKIKPKVSNIEFDNKEYLEEKVTIKYNQNMAKEKFRKKITASVTSKSKNFLEAYSLLLTEVVRKNSKAKDSGLIIPSSDITVGLNDKFILTCKFDIYLY